MCQCDSREAKTFADKLDIAPLQRLDLAHSLPGPDDNGLLFGHEQVVTLATRGELMAAMREMEQSAQMALRVNNRKFN